jgi:hypothetical protein
VVFGGTPEVVVLCVFTLPKFMSAVPEAVEEVGSSAITELSVGVLEDDVLGVGVVVVGAVEGLVEEKVPMPLE